METKEKPKPDIFAHMLSHEEINGLPGREMKEKRTRTGKLYDLGGGHYQAVLYPEPVHVRNAQGEWEEIDHTLSQKEGILENNAADLAVQFAPGGSVALTKGKYTLSWTLPDAAPVEAEEDQSAKVISLYPRHAENRVLESTVRYTELLPGVDLTAHILPFRFKDTITFKNAQAVRPVEFHVYAPGLNLEQQENGDVLALDGEQMIFRLPAPFAMDEQGNAIPGSARVDLKELDRGYWSWIVALDADYAVQAAFPVSIDPVVETERTSDAASMAYVSSKNPNTNYPATGYSTNIACNNYNLGKCNTFLRFHDNALPEIDSSYYVTSGILTMKTTAQNGNVKVYVKEVTGTWDQSTITYNNCPTVNTRPVEYQSAKNVTGAYINFNITNLVRQWYAGNNKGIMLESLAGGLVQLGAMGAVYDKPYVTIDYVSLAGLEGYLAQESHGCGRAGTAYVGLFNGNLVVAHQDTVMNGNLMPFSLTRYYNSCYRDVNAFGAGYGWKYSSQQTLHKETIGSVLHYVYMDGDGTRHHFKETSGSWHDLSGLSLKLTISNSIATITDKGDNTMTFDEPTVEFNNNYNNVKMIKTMTDAQGNTITFTHDGRLTTSIVDGANRTTTITATSITAPTMGAVSSVYSADHLIEITDNNIPAESSDNPQRTVYYEYNANHLLTKMKNRDKSSIEFTYTSQEPYRVTLVKYKDTDETVCGGRKYEYGDCRTTVTEMIPDDDALTEGKSLIYHFNDAGNVVSVNDGLGYGCFAGYSASMPLNHPEYTSKMQRAVNNYLKNHNFLTVNSDWTSENLNGASGTGAYNSDEIYAGGRAYKLNKTSANGQVTVYQNVTLVKGKTYTFSCYYKTAGSSSVQIRAEYKNSSGTTVFAESAAAVSTDRWNRVFVPFTIPSNSTSTTVTVRMLAVDGIGSVWVDAAQVEDGPVANRYNLMQNGAFTMNSSGVPTGWTAGDYNVSGDDRLVSGSDVISGRPTELTGNVLQMKGAAGVEKTFSQYFSCMGSAGDTFVAGGWSANYSRPRFDTATGVPCLYQMEVQARQNSSSPYETVGRVRWSDEWSGWHFAAIPIVMQNNYSAIRIKLVYQDNLNEAQFCNLFLHKEEFGKTFAYDSKGNVISVKNLAALEDYAVYDSFNNVTTYRQPGHSYPVEYTQTWGSSDAEKKKHLLRTRKSPLSIWQEYDYDSKGNPTSAKTRNGSSSLVIGGTTAYNDATYPNYVASQTDARGKTVTTVTDANKGTVTSVIDPNNQTVSYAYDTLKRNTGTETTADSKTYKNTYTYTGDLLTKVAHNTASDNSCDVEYNFAFDAQNRPTTVSVGAQTLSTNTYNTAANMKYGTLQKVTYGNSTSSTPQSVSYEYDDYKRVTKVTVDDDPTKTYQFHYGANGQVARLIDSILNRVIYSEYDVENRPMRITITEGSGHVYTGQVWYDQYNNLKTFQEWVGVGKTQYRTDFAYDTENKPTLLTYGDTSNKVEYVYDGIGRASARKVTVGGGGAYETSYSYLPGSYNGSTTTPLIAGISQTGETFTYTYDNVGNIKTVTQNGKLTTYTYDKLGQLIRVDDQNDPTSDATNGTTWTYAYDRGGNILEKKRYAYTTGTLGTALETVTYTYDTSWKDKLVGYGNTTIEYDNIGNPTITGTKTGEVWGSDTWYFTWEKGRQLKQMVKTGTTATFKYNSEGLRVQKTVNGTVTNYTLHGKNIVHLTQGSNTLHFWYDAQNRPAIVEWNNGSVTAKYAYIHNLQGDIVGIIDSSGNEVVKYTYDAWGKVLSTTGSLASTLGTVQPFRYRGYVYDAETGLYYLRSRYYNPVWGRFINADSKINENLFGYCSNNPIMFIDTDGHDEWGIQDEGCGGAGICLIWSEGRYTGGPIVIPIIEPVQSLPVSSPSHALSSVIVAGATVVTAEEISEKLKQRIYTVYTLVDEKDTVQYVGRTKCLSNRLKQHKLNPNRCCLKLDSKYDNLNYLEARGLEEYLIVKHHTLNKLDQRNNQIHGIRKNNPNRSTYLAALFKIISALPDIIENRVEDDLYNLLE